MTYEQLIRQAEECRNTDDSVQAMQLYAEAAKMDPGKKEPLVRLSELFSEHGDVEGAAGFLEKAVEVEPRNAFVRLQLGLAYHELRRMPEAIRHLKAAVLIIQHFVLSTRIDVMFVEDEGKTEVLAEADEIEETGMQALELLRSIADEFTFEEADVRTVGKRSSTPPSGTPSFHRDGAGDGMSTKRGESPGYEAAGQSDDASNQSLGGVETFLASEHLERLRLAS